MRIRIVLSVVSSMLLLAGCQSGSGTAMAEPPVKLSGSLASDDGGTMVSPSWIAVGTTDWVIAPINISEASFSTYSLTKFGSRLPQLPRTDGFDAVGSGPWINFAIFNRTTGKSTLALDRRMTVWNVARSKIESDSVLLLTSDTDTNRDGKLNDLDATAVYHLQLAEGKLTRLTPDRTTVVSASPDPIVGGAGRDKYGEFSIPENPAKAPVNGLLVTVRTDINNDGKFMTDEPTQVIRIDPSLKTKPQSVMDASQWQKAIDIWKNG